METGMTLLTITAVIGGWQLADRIVKRVGKMTHRTRHADLEKPNVRDDWYCFFSLSKLYGTTPESSDRKPSSRDTVKKSDEINRRRQLQANRPRVHV